MTTQSTRAIKPNILYYGTPVILLTTLNADHTVNISPLSSSWGLGQYIILGMSMKGKAVENLQQHPECVINIPEHSLWKNVEKLAAYTAKNPVPKEKEMMGFSYCKNKYDISGLTPEYRPTSNQTESKNVQSRLRLKYAIFAYRTILLYLPLSKQK